MTQVVLYTSRWNDLTRQPVRGHSWLTEDEARRRYEASEGVEIVDALLRDPDGTPRPRWVMGSYGRVRLQFFTPAGAVRREVDYDLIDGRLWRWVTVDCTYADDEQHDQVEAVLSVEVSSRPDGTGTVSIDDSATGRRSVSRLTDVPTDGGWLDVPSFGEWGPLVDHGSGAS